ncbi:MAG: hypothetical protein ACT4PE_16310 [Candidatus Eiseniibacteriota bacterium]
MKTRILRDDPRSRLLAWTLAGIALLAMAGDASADPTSRKLERQLGLFERVLDDMLVDSPNWLVQSHSETRGVYVDGHGVIFTFDASLTGSSWDFGHGGKWWNWWRDDDDGRRVIVIDDDWEDEDDSDRADRRSERSEWYERDMARQERRYTRGKTEVVEALVDFADLLTEIPDAEHVEIEAFLEDSPYFYDKDLRRLSVRAKMSDIRAFAAGSIDEKTLVERIQTKES